VVGEAKKEAERAGCPQRSVVWRADGFRDVAALAAACSRDPLVRRRCRPGLPVLAVRLPVGLNRICENKTQDMPERASTNRKA